MVMTDIFKEWANINIPFSSNVFFNGNSAYKVLCVVYGFQTNQLTD